MINDRLEPALQTFLAVLKAGWDAVGNVAALKQTDPQEFRSDWAQANWEAIVEAGVSDGYVFLEPYGDGADCNQTGSRVWVPGAVATHAVVCMPLLGDSAVDRLIEKEVVFPQDGLVVDRFASLTAEGWHSEQAPFDHVLSFSSGQSEMLFRSKDLRFELRKV